MKEETLNEHEKAVNKVVDYINNHLYETPGIRELSEVANISGFYLHRIFKTIIGENIGEFILRLRIEDIALRLIMTKDCLTSIAIQTGYGTKHSLSRAFKNYFGVTPSSYRKQPKNIHPFFGKEARNTLELKPEIVTLKTKTVAYIRVIDVYGAAESFQNAWARLGEFAKKEDLLHKDIEFIGLSFDNPAITHPSRCRFYACFTPNREIKPKGAIGVRQIPGGCYAVFLHRGAYRKLKDTYYHIYIDWLPQSRLKTRGSMSFEKYLNSPTKMSEEDLLTEIYIPIAK